MQIKPCSGVEQSIGKWQLLHEVVRNKSLVVMEKNLQGPSGHHRELYLLIYNGWKCLRDISNLSADVTLCKVCPNSQEMQPRTLQILSKPRKLTKVGKVS